MKRSLKSLSLFTAGALCATVLAGVTPQYMGGEEWDARMKAWLKEGELLGSYVVEVHKGRVYINPGPIACPKPPQPKLPDLAVNPWAFAAAVQAGSEKNQLLMVGSDVAARETTRCQTVPPELSRY